VSKRPELLQYINLCPKLKDMKVVENGYANLPVGTVVEVMGKDLAMVRFVREKKPAADAPNRKDGEAARTYFHFSVGGRGFTIDESDMDSVNLLRDKAQKRNVASLILEATEHNVPILDEDLQPTGDFESRKSFRFVSIVTAEDAKAYAKTAGEVAQEEAKWAPKTTTVSQADLSKAIAGALAVALPAAFAAYAPKPAPAPAAVPAGEAEENVGG
jgi:hypothetical protein